MIPHYLIATILVTLYSVGVKSQTLVWDVASMEMLIANHKAQHSSFSQIKNQEAAMSVIQKQISEKMVQIEYFESKLFNSLKSVSAIVQNGKDIIYASSIVMDIRKYQTEMGVLATNDPKLLLVAAQTQLHLIKKTDNLIQYIYQVAVVGTDVNLMNNQQRLELLKYVLMELRTMRGLAYSICLQMKTAQRNGILNTLYPGVFKYKDNRSKIVEQILKEAR